MTIDELKAELDALGIEYKAKATKDELEALYAPYAPAKAEPTDEEPTAQAESDPTADVEQPAVRVALDNPEASLNVRTVPGGQVMTAVPNGTVLESVGAESDGWLLVLVPGWVRADLVEPCGE